MVPRTVMSFLEVDILEFEVYRVRVYSYRIKVGKGYETRVDLTKGRNNSGVKD